MKKVAIITLHYPYNYGSALQAYALQSCIEEKGIGANVIDYRMRYDFENYRLFRHRLYREKPQRLIADIVFFPKNLKRRQNFRRFQTECLHMTKKTYTDWRQMQELNDEYDGFICGSDQIWNLDCTNGVDPAYYLGFAAPEKLKIAYAPSIAQLSFQSDDVGKLRAYLSRFAHLSVREASTVSLVQDCFDGTIHTVIDPTLLAGAQLLRRIERRPKTKKYVFVYLLEDNSELIRYAKAFAQERNLKLVYISNVSKKAQRQLRGGIDAFGVSPELFLGYIDGAEYVITNSYHATIFSLLFHKRFVTFRTGKSFPRMMDLLSALELTDQIYREGFDLDRPIDYASVERRLESMRSDSMRYLDRALEEITNEV